IEADLDTPPTIDVHLDTASTIDAHALSIGDLAADQASAETGAGSLPDPVCALPEAGAIEIDIPVGEIDLSAYLDQVVAQAQIASETTATSEFETAASEFRSEPIVLDPIDQSVIENPALVIADLVGATARTETAGPADL